MNREQFRTLVLEISRVHGQQYLLNTQVAELDDLILEGLQRFCAETKALYSDKVAFTLSTSVDGRFDMRSDTYFAKPMFEIRRVVINSNTLLGPTERSGVWSLEQIESDIPNYRTDSSNTPRYAVMVPPTTLLLVPAPSSTSGTHYVSGWYLHPDFENDQTDLALNLEDQRPAAYCVAYDLCLPHANGPGIEKLEYLRKLANDQKADVMARAARKWEGHNVRGRFRETAYRL